MFTIYLLLQLIFLILFVIGKVNNTEILILNIFKYLPILLNLLFSFTKRIDVRLKLGLLFTAIADYCFLFINNYTLGVAFFILVQTFYYLYIRKSREKILIFFSTLNIVLVLVFNENLLIVEAIIYSIFMISNILKLFKLSKLDNDIKLLKYSLILLLLCDLCIAIKYVFNLNYNIRIILDLVEWICYIPSQVILIIYSLKKIGTTTNIIHPLSAEKNKKILLFKKR